jgi:hypothetical protein
VVGGKMASAAEFWQMTPGQVWWLVEDMMPKQVLRRPKDMQEVVSMVKRSKAKEKAAV